MIGRKHGNSENLPCGSVPSMTLNCSLFLPFFGEKQGLSIILYSFFVMKGVKNERFLEEGL